TIQPDAEPIELLEVADVGGGLVVNRDRRAGIGRRVGRAMLFMRTVPRSAAIDVPVALDVEPAVGAHRGVLVIVQRRINAVDAEPAYREEVQHVVVPVGLQIERRLDNLDKARHRPGRSRRRIDVVVEDLISFEVDEQPEAAERYTLYRVVFSLNR